MGSLASPLVEIHRSAREMPIAEFQGFALGLVRSLVPFDASRWVNVELSGGRAITHCAHLFDGAYGILLERDPVDAVDQLLHAAISHPGTAHAVHANACHASREYARLLYYTRRHGHASSLCIAQFTAIPQHVQGLLLFRNDERDAFTECDRRSLEELMPHLVEAVTTNRLIAISRAGFAEWAPERAAAAISDADGWLHFAGSGFNNLLRLEWPDWVGARLPAELLQGLVRFGTEAYRGAAITVTMTNIGDMLFLKAGRACPLRGLTQRELGIARLYASGYSNKEVAKRLEISPATVRTFLQRVYAKLEIQDKAQLALLIRSATGCQTRSCSAPRH